MQSIISNKHASDVLRARPTMTIIHQPLRGSSSNPLSLSTLLMNGWIMKALLVGSICAAGVEASYHQDQITSSLFDTRLLSSMSSCACQPVQLRLSFDLGLACEDNNIEDFKPRTITKDRCFVEKPEATAAAQPIAITEFRITEFSQSIGALNSIQLNRNDNGSEWITGDSFVFESMLSTTATSSLPSTTLPDALQVYMVARDEFNQRWESGFTLQFSSTCNLEPTWTTETDGVLQVGWVSLTALEPPPLEFCPHSSVSENPSAAPVESPTVTREGNTNTTGNVVVIESADPRIGTEICACQPAEVTLTFDFLSDCFGANSNVADFEEGIVDHFCSLVDYVDGILNQPVTAVEVVFVEGVLTIVPGGPGKDEPTQPPRPGPTPPSPNSVFGNWTNGDSITLVLSSSDILLSTVTAGDLPHVFDLVIVAEDSEGRRWENSIFLEFTSECTINPLWTDALTIGWANLTADTSAPPELCPVAVVPTLSPVPQFSVAPSMASMMNSESPSTFLLPTSAPTESNVPSTGISFSASPSDMPSPVPSTFASVSPSMFTSTKPSFRMDAEMPSIGPTPGEEIVENSNEPTSLPAPQPRQSISPSSSPSELVPPPTLLPSVLPSTPPTTKPSGQPSSMPVREASLGPTSIPTLDPTMNFPVAILPASVNTSRAISSGFYAATPAGMLMILVTVAVVL